VTGFDEKSRWWSYRRQRLGRQAPDAGEARFAGGAGLMRVALNLFERPGVSLLRVI
jgi:hypothetical protein